MKKNNIPLFLFCTILFCYSNITFPKIYFDSSGTKTTTNNNVLDLIILLDKNEEELELQKNATFKLPVTRTLIIAINQEEAIIASNSLIRALILFSKKKNGLPAKVAIENLIKNFTIYKNKDESFAILIPNKKYKNLTNLNNIGLSNKLIKIENNENAIRQTFKTKYKDIKLDDLLEILEQNHKTNKIKKRIFLIGHGTFDKREYIRIISEKKITPTSTSKIAQLDYEQYAKLLNHLKKINCTFLYIISCYISGWNQLVMLSKQRIYLPFPLVISGLPDNKTNLNENAKYNTFFSDLNTFLTTNFQEHIQIIKPKEKHESWIIKSPQKTLNAFKKILINIAGPKIQNIPLIEIPNSFAPMAIPLDNKTKVITYELFPKTNKTSEYTFLKRKKQDNKIYKINQSIENLLIYPTIINTPIEIENVYSLNKIKSMVPGRSHHYIKKLLIKLNNINDLKNFFLTFYDKKNPFKKFFFIDTLEIKLPSETKTLKNIALKLKPRIMPKTINLFTGLLKKDNKYLDLNSYLFKINKEIPKGQATELIRKFAKETTPAPQALKQATIIETERNFNKSINKSLGKFIKFEKAGSKLTGESLQDIFIDIKNIGNKINSINTIEQILEDQSIINKLEKIINQLEFESIYVIKYFIREKTQDPIISKLTSLINILKYMKILFQSEKEINLKRKISKLLTTIKLKNIFKQLEKKIILKKEKILTPEEKEIKIKNLTQEIKLKQNEILELMNEKKYKLAMNRTKDMSKKIDQRDKLEGKDIKSTNLKLMLKIIKQFKSLFIKISQISLGWKPEKTKKYL